MLQIKKLNHISPTKRHFFVRPCFVYIVRSMIGAAVIASTFNKTSRFFMIRKL